MVLTVAGDFALSPSRGEPRNWMIREQNADLSLKKQLIVALKQKFHLPVLPSYRNYPVVNIQLPEYTPDFKEPFGYKIPEDPFCNIQGLFTEGGINFLNLESPFTEKGRHIGDHKSSPKYLELLKKHNISLVSVANNHAFDQCEEGFFDTLQNLEKEHLSYVGGGYTLDDAIKPVILER